MEFRSAEEKRNYMLEEPVKRLVCRLAVPTIMSMLVTSFYNMADTFFVGKLNTQSTAAVGVVFSLMAPWDFCSAMVPEIIFQEN